MPPAAVTRRIGERGAGASGSAAGGTSAAGVSTIARPSGPDRPIDGPSPTATVAPFTAPPVVTSLTQTTVRSFETATQAAIGVTWRMAWAGRSPRISTTYQPAAMGS